MLDPMLDLVAQLPEQLADSVRLVDRVDGIRGGAASRRALVFGMGGSAAAASLLAGLAPDRGFGLEVHRGYEAPLHVDPDAVLVFSSYSGNTEEILSVYDHARRIHPGQPRVVLSSGGALGERAQEHGIPWVELPGGLPPRASLGYGVGVLSGVLARLGWMEDLQERREEGITILEEGNRKFGKEAPTSENPAARLARRLYGKLPLLYAGVGLAEAAAWRAKAQLNENSKSLAYVSTLPELNHNEVVGWESATAVHGHVFVLALRDPQDHHRIQRRFEITRELLGDKPAGWEDIDTRGQGDLARLLSLVQFFDYLSVYLAGEASVDPMTVDSIDQLKQRLADVD